MSHGRIGVVAAKIQTNFFGLNTTFDKLSGAQNRSPLLPFPPPNFDLGWPIVVICMDETMQILKNVGVDGLTRAVSNCNCHKKALFKKGLDSTKKKSPCKTIFYTILLTCPPFLRAIFKKVFCQILQFGLLQLLNLDLLNFNAHVEQYKLFTIFVDIIDHKFKIVN